MNLEISGGCADKKPFLAALARPRIDIGRYYYSGTTTPVLLPFDAKTSSLIESRGLRWLC
jgi:hypothetical protein